jgi:hypothetical protein
MGMVRKAVQTEHQRALSHFKVVKCKAICLDATAANIRHVWPPVLGALQMREIAAGNCAEYGVLRYASSSCLWDHSVMSEYLQCTLVPS